MKTQIKQAPDYTMDENGVIYNSKDEVMTIEDGVVRLTVDGLRRRFKVLDLKPNVSKPNISLIKESVKKEKIQKGEGVIATIQSLITETPITEVEILQHLAAKFPQKISDSMKKTIHVQIGGNQPTRMEKEKKFTLKIEKKDNIKYFSL